MRRFREHIYVGQTQSTCPICLNLVNAKIVVQNGNVYFQKRCPEHGYSEALISEDAEYYLDALKYAKPGSIPHHFATQAEKGCPKDCGLCSEHEQHCCHPIVEVTDKCNLDCPICIADNSHSGFISLEEFSKRVEVLIIAEGSLENLTLSGGEPTLHPQFWDLIDIAQRPEILRISVVTNGIKLIEDANFCKRLVEKNVYLIFQWDGFSDDAYMVLRGKPLLEKKNKILQLLEQYNIPTQLIFVAARGINEDQIGKAVDLLISNKFILSLAIQPLSFSGAGYSFPCDPMNRITIEGVIKAIAEQTNIIRKNDFFPLPCSNPHCVSLTYLLCLNDGFHVPFPRFTDMKKHLHLLSQSATLSPNQQTEQSVHEIVNDLWSTAGENPDSEKIIKALRRATLEMFDSSISKKERVQISERQAKSIFIHHYMDRYNFDLARIRKCCHHYPKSKGRNMPICSYNLFYRSKEGNEFDSY